MSLKKYSCEAWQIQGNLSFATVLHWEFVACFTVFSTVCALGGLSCMEQCLKQQFIYDVVI